MQRNGWVLLESPFLLCPLKVFRTFQVFEEQTLRLRTPRPATEPRDGPARNFHDKYRKNTPRPKFWNPKKIPPKYRKNTKINHFWYFQGIFLVFSGYFGGKFWESRISGRCVFFRYFSCKFRVGPFRGSVAGRGVLKLKGAEKKRTLQKHPFGQPFLCTTPSPLLSRAPKLLSGLARIS